MLVPIGILHLKAMYDNIEASLKSFIYKCNQFTAVVCELNPVWSFFQGEGGGGAQMCFYFQILHEYCL